MKAQRGVDVDIYSFFNVDARCGGQSTPSPGRFTPGKENRYPLYTRLRGPQGRSGRVRKIDPRTVQHVASRYPGPQGVIFQNTYILTATSVGTSRLASNPVTRTHS
jgi:hypothetical protein